MRRRALRWMLRGLLGLVVLVLLTVAAAAITLHTDWGRDKVRAQIEAKLKPYFPAGARVGRLEGSVLGDFSIHDIELTDREGRRAITIKRIDLNIELGAWLDDEARVERMIVDGVDIALHQRGGEPPNVATMFQPNPDPLTFDVILERLEVRNAAISITKDARVDHLDGLTLDAVVKVGQSGAVGAEVQVRGLWRERAAPLVLDTTVAIDPLGTIEIPALVVAVGGVKLDGRDISYAGEARVQGRVHVTAPEGALAALAPELVPPQGAIDLHLGLGPSTAARGLALSIRGTVAGTSVLGSLAAQPLEPRPVLGGVLMIHGFDAQAVTARSPSTIPSPMPSTDLRLTAVVALAYEPERPGVTGVRGTVSFSGAGRVDEIRFDRVAGGLTFDDRGARVVVEADGAGDTHVRADGHLALEGAALVLSEGRVSARTRRLDQAAQGQVAIAGALTADLAVTGRVAPGAPRLTVSGTITGRGLRRDDLRVGTLDVRFEIADVPGQPGGRMTVRTTGVRAGATVVPDVIASARGRYGGGYDVTVAADDQVRGVRGEVRAAVTLGDLERTYGEVRLTSYDVTARGLRIQGRGGRISATHDRVTVTGVRGTAGDGSFALDASAPLARPDGVTGELAITGIALERLHSIEGFPAGLRGTIDVKAGLERGRGHLSVAVRAEAIGSFTASVEVVPPRRPTDPGSWMKLDRRAIKALHIEATQLDLAAAATALEVKEPLQGVIDGALHLEGTQRTGELHVRGLVAAGLPVPLDADLVFDLEDPTVTKVELDANLRTIGRARVTAAVRAPVQLFDARAWRRLGVAAVDRATLRIDRFEIDELMAARFGLGTLRGVFAVDISAEAGLRRLDAKVGASDLLVGPLVEPATIAIEAKADGGRTTLHAVVSLRGKTVAEAEVEAPVDVLAELRRGLDPARIKLAGKLTMPEHELSAVTAALGQARRLPGKVHGSGTITGTMADPVVEGAVVIENLGARTPRTPRTDRARSGGTGRAGAGRGGIRELKISGSYRDGAVEARMSGRQDDGGDLDVRTAFQLARPEAAVTSIDARAFQLRPLARLLPEVLFGVSGQLDADLDIVGLVPEKVKLRGTTKLSGATLPLSDLVGVLRDGEVLLEFKPGGGMRATVKGALEAGRIEAVANVTLDGVMPRTGTVDVTVRGIELITTSAPRLDGKLHADLAYDGAQLKVTARIEDGEVRSRASKGRALHPSNLPADLVFASTAPGVEPPRPVVAKVREFVGAEPAEPFLLMTLKIAPVTVTMPELRGDVTGDLRIAVGVDGASIDGKVEVQRGDIELLERRYRLRRAVVSFDGGFDPLLDVQVERDLPELTLYAAITGRLSSPELKLSSDPPNYTQGQLLSFAISDTAASPGNETTDAASNLLAAVASQTLLSFITPILPVRLDVVAYEPASASTSRAFVFGRWITRKLLVLYRNRAEARPTENVNEAEAEYWINRRVLLEGVAGDRGVLGLDLLWTRRW